MLVWQSNQTAADEHYQGCFDRHSERWAAAGEQLMAHVIKIYATANHEAFESLQRRYVDAEGAWKIPRDAIQ